MSDDKLVSCINDFKKSLNGQTIKIHNNDYATVALRIGIFRRNLGTAASISTSIIFHDDKKVIVKAEVFIDGKLVSTGIAWLLRFRILVNNGLIFQSQVSYLIPIFGTILSYIFLKELITTKVLISLLAVVIGIYFVKKAN